MDPQQRIGLRIAWRALEHSGINPDDLAGHDVGCYVGASGLEYGPATVRVLPPQRSSDHRHLAGRHLRADRLHARPVRSGVDHRHLVFVGVDRVPHRCGRGTVGDCDMALAGGVCVMGTPGYFVEFSKQHALSDDEHCRPYSAHASGTVLGRGCGDVRVAAQIRRPAERSAHPGRGARHRRQPGRPDHRSDRAQWRRPAAVVRQGDRAGGRAARGRRHDRRPRHRHPPRRPDRITFAGTRHTAPHPRAPAPCWGR